jgi:hypothetical protein
VRGLAVQAIASCVRARLYSLRKKSEFQVKLTKNPSGAKARLCYESFTARLKSCPDTERRIEVLRFPSPKIRTWGSHSFSGSQTCVTRRPLSYPTDAVPTPCAALRLPWLQRGRWRGLRGPRP